MRKTRVVGISALCAGMVLLALIMAHYLTAVMELGFPDGAEATSNRITLDPGWVDVMQYGVFVFFMITIVCAARERSYGMIATLGVVSFFIAALFEDLLTQNLEPALLITSVVCVIVTLMMAFTEGRPFVGFLPKTPDDASGVSQTTSSHGGGWAN